MSICAVQKQCGGCPNLELPPELELRQKTTVVQELLAAVGFELSVEATPLTERQLGYRSRIRMACVDGRIDFFNTLKTNGCAVLDPNLYQAADQLIRLTAANPALINQSGAIELRVSDVDDRIGFRTDFTFAPDQLSQQLGDKWLIQTPDSATQTLTYELLPGWKLKVPLSSFVQVNLPVMRQILRYLQLEFESISPQPDTLLDLYAGFGSYTYTLEPYLQSSQLVEIELFACHAARTQLNTNVEVFEGPVESLTGVLQPADLVIVNPGRAGLKEVADKLTPLVQQALIYISCNPQTLATDLAVMAGEGIKPQKAGCFDMFPGTNHIETVVTCTKSVG